MTIDREDVLKRWVEALRSGEYKQGQGHLKAINGEEVKHCCIGVLCEVVGLKESIVDHNKQPCFVDLDGETYSASLPDTLKDELDIAGEHEGRLYQMNDSDVDPKTFNEIADYIEKEIINETH